MRGVLRRDLVGSACERLSCQGRLLASCKPRHGLHVRRTLTGPGELPHLQDVKFTMDSTINGLGLVTLHRPDRRDALSEAMASSMIQLCSWLQKHSPGDLRCIIITGSSPKSFSAGRDLQASASHADAEQRERYMSLALNSVLAVKALRVPAIACMYGASFGWGMELALACDIRVAARDSIMCFPETRLGIFPGAGGAYLLPKLVGPAVANDLVLTSRRFCGEEAYRLGLVNYSVPGQADGAANDPMEKARDLAQQICSNGPLGCRAAKEVMRAALYTDQQHAIDFSSQKRAPLSDTKDFNRALDAFNKKLKDPPTFHGD